jgi:hypothetical protein
MKPLPEPEMKDKKWLRLPESFRASTEIPKNLILTEIWKVQGKKGRPHDLHYTGEDPSTHREKGEERRKKELVLSSGQRKEPGEAFHTEAPGPGLVLFGNFPFI